MVTDKFSVGGKIDYNLESKYMKQDTVGWLEANYYF